MSYPEEFSYEAGRNEEIAAEDTRTCGMRIYDALKKPWKEHIKGFLDEMQALHEQEESDALENFIIEFEEVTAKAYRKLIDKLGV